MRWIRSSPANSARCSAASPLARSRSPPIASRTIWTCWRSRRGRRCAASEAALARILAWVVSPRVHACHALAARLIADAGSSSVTSSSVPDRAVRPLSCGCRPCLGWEAVELRILGPFEVVDDDGRAVDVGGARPQALLVALALARGDPVSADQLLDRLWPGADFPARNRLQVNVSRLRKVLGGNCIVSRAGGYALEVPSGTLDADRFEELAARGR